MYIMSFELVSKVCVVQYGTDVLRHYSFHAKGPVCEKRTFSELAA